MAQVRSDLLARLAKGADNAGRVANKAVNVDVTGKLAKNAASKGEVSASMIQQLAMSDNAGDRMLLQAIVKNMPPERLDAILIKAFRDPTSPKDAPTLTAQGQMIADVARGGDPDPALTKTAAQGGGDTGIHEVDVGNVSDLPPKAAPYKPKTSGAGKELSDDPKFHVKERIVTKDGKTQVKTPAFNEKGELKSPKGSGSASVDALTSAAVKTAARGGKPKPIGDNAALKNSRSQEQNYSSAIARLAGLVDPRGVKDMPSPGFGPGMADKAVSGGVPNSAIKGAKPKPQRSAPMIAAESVVDYDEITRLANEAGLDIGMASTDPEEFARLLVSKADQGMFDATPLTGSQRAEMTDVARSLSSDPAQSGPVLRGAFPEEAAAGSMAGRQGSVQEQAIQAIARKIRDNFNPNSMPVHEGTADAALPPYKQTEGLPSQFSGYDPDAVGGTLDELPDTPMPAKTSDTVSGAGPAGDLTGLTKTIADMRAADRAPVVNDVSEQFGRPFTIRRVADIEAEMAGLSPSDPRYRELGIELRDAKLIDSYLEPHKRMVSNKTLNQATANANSPLNHFKQTMSQTAPIPAAPAPTPAPTAQNQSNAMKAAAALGQVPASKATKQATEGAKVRTLVESIAKGLDNTRATKDFIMNHGGTGVKKTLEYGIPIGLIGGLGYGLYSGAQYLFGGDDKPAARPLNTKRSAPFDGRKM